MLTSWSGYPFGSTCTEIAFIHDVSDLSDISNASTMNDRSLSDHSPRSGHAPIQTVRSVRSETDDPIRIILCGRSEMDDSETPPPPIPSLSLPPSLSHAVS